MNNRKILVSFAKAIILHRKIQVRNMRYIQITITFIVCALELLHKDNKSCLIYFLHYSLFSTYIYQIQTIKEYLYVKKGQKRLEDLAMHGCQFINPLFC